MAYFVRDTGSSLTPTQHSKNIFSEYLKMMYLKDMMGKKGSGKPIIIDDQLKGQAGDTLRFHFIPQNKTDGISGQDVSLEGNEDSLDEYYMDIKVDVLGKAFRKKGKMTDQRTIWNIRNEFKSQLTRWFAQNSENRLIWALTGVLDSTTFNTTTWTSATDTTDLVYGKNRCIRADGSTSYAMVQPASGNTGVVASSDNTALAAAMTSADKMSTALIEAAVIAAKEEDPYKITPVRASNGEEYFILMLDLRSARDLRSDPNWKNHKLSIVEAGIDPKKDPFATGALGIWDNVIIKKNERIVRFGTSGTMYARNLLLGADACVLEYVEKLDYTEKMFDYDRELGCAAQEIRGQKKVRFDDGVDMNVMQVITASN